MSAPEEAGARLDAQDMFGKVRGQGATLPQGMGTNTGAKMVQTDR